MRITYDKDANVAYISFSDRPAEVETHALSDAVNVDIAPDGTLHGIELLNANEQLRVSDDGWLVLSDPSTGEERRWRLVAA